MNFNTVLLFYLILKYKKMSIICTLVVTGIAIGNPVRSES